MPAQPRKATPRKTTPPKTPTDAAVAEATEDKGGFTVPYGGFDYEIGPDATQTLIFRNAMQRGGDTDIVASLLGPAQYQMLLARHAMENGEKVITEFMDAYAAARGSGNS